MSKGNLRQTWGQLEANTRVGGPLWTKGGQGGPRDKQIKGEAWTIRTFPPPSQVPPFAGPLWTTWAPWGYTWSNLEATWGTTYNTNRASIWLIQLRNKTSVSVQLAFTRSVSYLGQPWNYLRQSAVMQIVLDIDHVMCKVWITNWHISAMWITPLRSAWGQLEANLKATQCASKAHQYIYIYMFI